MKRKTEIKKREPVVLRPASREEAGLFYSELGEAKDRFLGTTDRVPYGFLRQRAVTVGRRLLNGMQAL